MAASLPLSIWGISMPKSFERHHYEGFGMALIRMLRHRRNGAHVDEDIKGVKKAMFSTGHKCGMKDKEIKRDIKVLSMEIV